MAGLILEFPASVDPVSLAEAKNFLRVDDIDDDDALITSLIKASTVACETFTNRSFINKGFIQSLDSFPYFTDTMLSQLAYSPSYYSLPRYSTTLWNYSQQITMMRPPLQSIDRITYCDSGTGSFRDLVPQPLPWYPQQNYVAGGTIADNNGYGQMLVDTDPSSTPTLKSGVKPPVWNKTLGAITTEASPATAVWINIGLLDQGEFGAFIVDKISEPGRVFPGIQTPKGQPVAGYWPSVLYIPAAVQLHFTAGYGPDATFIPDAIKTAVKLTLADFYENRTPAKDSEEQIPRSARALLGTYRVLNFAPTRG